MERDKRIPVTLVCVACRKEKVVHVPRERKTGKRVFWECLECQKGRGGRVFPAGSKG